MIRSVVSEQYVLLLKIGIAEELPAKNLGSKTWQTLSDRKETEMCTGQTEQPSCSTVLISGQKLWQNFKKRLILDDWSSISIHYALK